MTGLDCNILVQLALQDHPANAATITAVQAEVKRGNACERKKFQVFFRLKNPRRPVEPVEFEAVEFLSVNARAENKSFCHDGNQNEIVAAVRQTGATPVFVELPRIAPSLLGYLSFRLYPIALSLLP
jgi:hypothetical protein